MQCRWATWVRLKRKRIKCRTFTYSPVLSEIVNWNTHTQHPFNGPFPGLYRSAGTRKVRTTWILLKQETVSGSGISWAICKSAPRSRQITMPAPHHSVVYRPDALPAAQPTASKHWSTEFCTMSLYISIKLLTYLWCTYLLIVTIYTQTCVSL